MATNPRSQLGSRPVRSESFGLMDALHAMTDIGLDAWHERVPESVVKETQNSDRGLGGSWMRSLVLPPEFLLRDLSVGTPSAGGNLAGHPKDLRAGALDNHSALAAAGLTIIPFSVGEVPSVPAVDAAVIAGVAATEGGAVPLDTGATFRAVTPTMSTLGVTVNISRRLMIQAGRAGRDFIMAEIARAVGRELDRLVLGGSGIDGEFSGIFTLNAEAPATPTSTFEWSHVQEAMALLLAYGVKQENIRWIGTPAVRKVLAKRPVELLAYSGHVTTGALIGSFSGRPIWDGSTIDGLPAYAASECPAGGLVAADFSKLIVGVQGVTLIVDARVSTAGTNRVTMLLDASMVAPQMGCFRALTGVV